MNVFSFSLVLWLVGVFFMPLNSFRGGVNQSILVSGRMIVDGDTMTTNRNLKENRNGGEVSLEDYRPVDPSPSRSKASVKHGPIQHGTPPIYIPPKPSPPFPSPFFNQDGSP
ncbi:hypothetical protein SOVF_027220 [Spinacia oleracea]|uniref:Transmembrane protein n=1 Tax=Spinacia oleracea TaxID=3562 RepID=A0A9R0I719_SPIOL|nr:uncharacterized protein LOC110783687 [Spinacia oleracea]KNA23168.1 hypothetical protein SOVF_027220 [Spinacia oleracea]